MVEEHRGFRAETYAAAADEHAAALSDLHKAGRYGLSHYVGGLAAECVFRAFKCRMDTELDERHDLRLLSRRFIEKVPNRLLTKVAAAVGELVNRWDNAHRFRSEDAVRRFLTGRKLFARRGDLLEDSSRKIVSAALLIVGVGKNLWNR